MKKIKFVICAMSIATILTIGSVQQVRADCVDGQVPIGSKTCSLVTEPTVETEKEKPETMVDKLIVWFKYFGF